MTSPRAGDALLAGVPMPWMTRWAGSFPVFVERAEGARLVDVDGVEYVDLCLGDTGAMTGHALPAVADAVTRRARHGLTTMLRFAPHLTGRPRIAVMDWCYHGTVDETFATLEGDRVVPRPGLLGAPVDVAETTAVVPFNDADALDRRLAVGDVACLLMEPALTNIVLPDEGYLAAVREITRRHGVLLVLPAPAQRRRRCGRRRRRPRGVLATVVSQPRGAADAVPQHGAVLPPALRGRCGPAHRGVRRGGRGPARLR